MLHLALEDAEKWYGIPFWAFVIGLIPALVGIQGSDPLLWRANILINGGGNHTLILWSISLMFFLLWKIGKIRPIIAVSAVILIVAWHEILWWVTDVVWMLQAHYYVPWWVFFGWLSCVCYTCTLFYPQLLNLPWRFMSATAAYYAAWYAIGFEVTTNFIQVPGLPRGWTIWYGVPWVSGIEILSWYLPLLAFWLWEVKPLRIRQEALQKSVGSTLNNNPVNPSFT